MKKQNGIATTSRVNRLTAPGSESCEPERVVTVLAVCPAKEDQLVLQHIFGHSKWQLFCESTWQKARSVLGEKRVPVVISDSVLPDASWKDVLGELSSMPDLPTLIVSARIADEHLWGEVLNLGGYDVLAKPFDANEVFRVVSLAWLNWKDSLERVRAAAPNVARAVGL